MSRTPNMGMLIEAAVDEAKANRTEQQDAALAADVAHVLMLRRWIIEQTSGALDATRILGVVAAAPGAERYLSYTIPSLVRQIAAAGKWADIVIGLNNGFTCHAVAAFQALPHTHIVHVYGGEKPDETTPSPLFATPDLRGAPYVIGQDETCARQHRIIMLHQQRGPHAAGKIRMLGDIFQGLLLSSIRQGWMPPLYTVVFDAETLFLERRENHELDSELEQVATLLDQHSNNAEAVVNVLIQHNLHHVPAATIRTAGLDHPNIERYTLGLDAMIQELESDPTLDILGAITKFCVYGCEHVINGTDVLLPDFAAEISAMHLMYNYLCGLAAGCECLPGAGTIGKTEMMISLLAVTAATYPGTTSEDAIITILAEQAGFNAQLFDDILLTNRCPCLSDLAEQSPPIPAWKKQFARWYAGFDAVEQLYGRYKAEPILGPTPEMFFMASLAIFLKTLKQTGDVHQSLGLLRRFTACGSDYEEIRRLARNRPDILQGPNGRPAWSS